MKEKVILFGASKSGELAYELFKDKYEITYFIDNDSKRWNHKLCGIKIIEPVKLFELCDEYDEIIITSNYDVVISNQLVDMGIKKFGVFNKRYQELKFFEYSDIKSKERIALIMNNSSGSNSYALYKNQPHNIKEKYDVILCNKYNKDKDYYSNLIQSKVIVRTHDGSHYDDSQINIQLWHGFPLKGLTYMSKHDNIELKEERSKQWNMLKAIPSYSQMYNNLINACYGIKEDIYTITGMPRNDLLLTSLGKKNLSKVLNIDIKNKNIIFYMPTFRNNITGEINGDVVDFNILGMDCQRIKKLDMFLENLNTIMILKFHPSNVEVLNNILKETKCKNIIMITDKQLAQNSLDSYEILNSADILITDYSSVYFDYLLLDRPIIFTPLDLDEYSKKRGLLLEPFDFWTPGPKSMNLDELEQEIERCLSDKNYYKKERDTITNIVHKYKDSNSGKRVWQLIYKLLNGKD